ncbi:hypothetical protein [Oribacterium sp. WCC10]|uniref:hypothetical protein n=1 Tax=Oribacterium sp. WCC10 TaxID=1855343 RepID=UPI0008E1C31C|nr:hypothetical protein [Oribacterium sp. WCC10]SFG73388.1 hypothetical protein SAMN05216356_12226 [Oribacterium sp. WCC10]
MCYSRIYQNYREMLIKAFPRPGTMCCWERRPIERSFREGVPAWQISIGICYKSCWACHIKEKMEKTEKERHYSTINENRMSRMMKEMRAEIARLRPVIPFSEGDISMVRNQAKKTMNTKILSDPEGWYVAMVLSGYLSDDRSERLRLSDILHAHMTGISASLVYTNPYYENIFIPEELTFGSHHYERLGYEQGEIIELNPDLVDGMYVPHYGYMRDYLEVPCITEDKPEESVWMSLSPGEIITMKEDIEAAKGSILTLGLGLGYYAYMTARKPEVTEVTVIERDAETITLFENYIRMQLGKDPGGRDIAEKIRIVQTDAFTYMNNVKDGEYDMIFADLWEGPFDGKPMYQELHRMTQGFRKTEMRYWILPQMLSI